MDGSTLEKEQATKFKKIVKTAARRKLRLSQTSSSPESGQLQVPTPVSSSPDVVVAHDMSGPFNSPYSTWSSITPQRSIWSDLSHDASFDLEQSAWDHSENSDITLGDVPSNCHTKCE
jgi:hypothetical protein